MGTFISSILQREEMKRQVKILHLVSEFVTNMFLVLVYRPTVDLEYSLH